MATIVDMGDPDLSVPSFLLFDASVLLELFSFFSKPKSRACLVQQFLKRVQDVRRKGDCLPFVSIQTLMECYHKILWIHYQNDGKLDKRREAIAHHIKKDKSEVTWRHLYKDSPEYLRRYCKHIEAFRDKILAIPIEIIEPEDLAMPKAGTQPMESRLRHYMCQDYLWTHDAHIIAVAERLEISNIATFDRDFERLGDEFTLYTLPHN